MLHCSKTDKNDNNKNDNNNDDNDDTAIANDNDDNDIDDCCSIEVTVQLLRHINQQIINRLRPVY